MWEGRNWGVGVRDVGWGWKVGHGLYGNGIVWSLKYIIRIIGGYALKY